MIQQLRADFLRRPGVLAAAGAAIVVVGAAGCGSSSSSSSSSSGSGQANKPAASSTPEISPSGDIPDNQAYVAYSPPGGGYSLKFPEGWSRTTAGGAVTFASKLNSIRVETVPAQGPLTAAQARQEMTKLAQSVKGFKAGSASVVSRHAGHAVRITYLADAKVNQVTGKATREAVERYVFFHKGKDVVLTLSAPKGADNVDPWRIVTNSVRWTA